MPTTCTNLQQSLAWCQGTQVLPGVRRRIYYIAKSDIVSWPTLPKNAAGKIIAPLYAGNFSLAQGTTWKFIDILPDKSQLVSEPQGEFPSQTQLNKLTAVHPAVDDTASAAALYVNNNDCVFIVQDMKGKYRVIGCDRWQTKASVNQDLGQGPTGTASTTINVEASDICPAPFYEGEIETEDGTINESSNTQSGNGSNNGIVSGDGTDNVSDNGGSAQQTTNYTVTISVPTPQSDRGNIQINDRTVGQTDSLTVPAGTQVTIKGIPAAGYVFNRWSDMDTNNTRTLTVNADVTMTANFKDED